MAGDPLLVIAKSSGEKGQANAILMHILSAIAALDAIWETRRLRASATDASQPDPPILSVDFTSFTKDRAVSYRALLAQGLSYPSSGLAVALPTLSCGTRSLQMLTRLTQTGVPCHDLGIMHLETTDSTLRLTTAKPTTAKLGVIQSAVSHNIIEPKHTSGHGVIYRGSIPYSSRLYALLGIPGVPDALGSPTSDAPGASDDNEERDGIIVQIGLGLAHFGVRASGSRFFVRAPPLSTSDGDSARIFLTAAVGAADVRNAIENPVALPDQFGLRFMRLLGFTLPEVDPTGEACPYSYQGITFDITHSLPYIVRLGTEHRVAYDVVVPVLCDGLLRGQDYSASGRRHVVYASGQLLFEPTSPDVELKPTQLFGSGATKCLPNRISGEIQYMTDYYMLSEVRFIPSGGRAASRAYHDDQCKLTIHEAPDLAGSYPVSFFSALAIGSDIVDGAAMWGARPEAQYPADTPAALPTFDFGMDGYLQGDAINIAASGPFFEFLGATIYGTYGVGPDRTEYPADRRIFAPCLGPTPKAAPARPDIDLAKIYALHRTEYVSDDEAQTYSLVYCVSGVVEIGGASIALSGDGAPYLMTTAKILKATAEHADEFVNIKAAVLGKIWHEYAITSAQNGTGWSVSSAGTNDGSGTRFPVPADLVPGARLDYAGARDLFGEEDRDWPLGGVALPDTSRPYTSPSITDLTASDETVEGALALVRKAIPYLALNREYQTSDDLIRYADLYGYRGGTPGSSLDGFIGLVFALMTPRGRPLKAPDTRNIMKIELRVRTARAWTRVVVLPGLMAFGSLGPRLIQDRQGWRRPSALVTSSSPLGAADAEGPARPRGAPALGATGITKHAQAAPEEDEESLEISSSQLGVDWDATPPKTPKAPSPPRTQKAQATEADQEIADSRAALRASLAILTFGLVAPRTAPRLNLTADLTEHSSDQIYQDRIRLFSSTFDAYLSGPLLPASVHASPECGPGGPWDLPEIGSRRRAPSDIRRSRATGPSLGSLGGSEGPACLTREIALIELFQIVHAEYTETLEPYLELVRALIENQSDMDAVSQNAPYARIIAGFSEAPRQFFANCSAALSEAISRHVPGWAFPEEANAEWREIIEEAASAYLDIDAVLGEHPEHPFLYPPSHVALLRLCARKHVLAASVGYEMAVYALRELNAAPGRAIIDAILAAAPDIAETGYVVYPVASATRSPYEQRIAYGISPISTARFGDRQAHLANFSILVIASAALPAIAFPGTLASVL
jgi:hypothetical protein